MGDMASVEGIERVVRGSKGEQGNQLSRGPYCIACGMVEIRTCPRVSDAPWRNDNECVGMSGRVPVPWVHCVELALLSL